MSRQRGNLLFLNVGRRVELIRAFRDAFQRLKRGGRLIGTDINGWAPALYEVDEARLLPHSSCAGFGEALARLCQQRGVAVVIPLIDPDLIPVAQAKPQLEAVGTRALISPLQTVLWCRDKRVLYQRLAREGFPIPRVIGLEAVRKSDLPLFVKASNGSAGLHAVKVNTLDELRFVARQVPRAVIQEFLEGDEVTVDVFSDWESRPLLAVPRRRLKVRAGEVSVGCVERDPEVEALACSVAARLKTVGPVNVQVFRSRRGVVISEVNPRFGGGAPLSIAAGAPFPEWTIRLASGERIEAGSVPLTDRLSMLRFDQSRFLPAEALLTS